MRTAVNSVVPGTSAAPLTAAQRRRLVEKPFGQLGVNRYPTSYPHAGTLIDRGRPEDLDSKFRRIIDNEESLVTNGLDEVSALWGE